MTCTLPRWSSVAAIAAASILCPVALAGTDTKEKKPPANEPLRQELLQMAHDDQQAILEVEADPGNAAIQSRWRGMPERNVARLKEVVAQYGWPGRSLVGQDGAHAAWLIAQHADTEPRFQRACLDQLRLAYEAGEATAMELSFLTDRVLTAEGKPQMYGTQGIGVSSPEDEARIDLNRAALGLEPWRTFIKKRQATHGAWLPETKPAAGARN
jgi:uncharacterized protein DUF6624